MAEEQWRFATYRIVQQMEPVVEVVDQRECIWNVVSLWAEEQQHSQRELLGTTEQTAHRLKLVKTNSDLNMFLSGSFQNITAAGEVPSFFEWSVFMLMFASLNSKILMRFSAVAAAVSIFVPVCVESFCYTSSRDGEAWLCVSVCQSREGRHSLHLPPAKLLQCVCVPFQQGWSAQVPQRSANVEADLSVGMRWRDATNVWCKWLGTLVAAGHPSGRHGCWTELQS